MLAIRNGTLRIEVLHPIEDAARLGTRYCHAGYVWQVTDVRRGPLLSGPEFPGEPDPLNGQGLPEVFADVPGDDDVPAGEAVDVIGVGRVRKEADGRFDPSRDRTLVRACDWDVRVEANGAEWGTRVESSGGRAWVLTRRVWLEGRTLRVGTELVNRGRADLPLRWYAHPFFPHTHDRRMTRFGSGITVPDHPTYARNGDGVLRIAADLAAAVPRYLPLVLAPGARLDAEQLHDAVGRIRVRGNFPLAQLPVWHNARTYSFEPYFARALAPGEGAAWSLEYAFDDSSQPLATQSDGL